jgi:transitional endoplasmic reticulum ATPase
MRPGRFDELIYVPVPEKVARLKILGIHAAKMPLADDVDLDVLAERTQGYTGADLEDLVRRAGMLLLRNHPDAQTVPMSVFEDALDKTRASVTEKMQEQYREMKLALQREAPRKDASKIGFG